MMNTRRQTGLPARSQQGMVLIVALIFLLLLTLIGVSSMQNATMQEKMAGSVALRNENFQTAEAALRIGENAVAATNYTLAVCANTTACAPPPDSLTLVGAGTGTTGVVWVVAVGDGSSGVGAGSGYYGVQKIGTSTGAVSVAGYSATLYRVTAVAISASGKTRTVLESIYAKY